MIRRLLVSLIPLAVCLPAAAGVELLAPDLQVLQLRVSIGWVLILLGLAASFFLVFLFLLYWLHLRRVGQALEAEQQVRTEAHDRFLKQLDHELKNPLTGLRAAVENLEDSASADPLPAVLPDIRLQVERMVHLTGDLRKLAELDDIPLELGAVNLEELAGDIVEAIRTQPLGAGRDIRMVFPRVPWPLSPVMADEDLLGSAFYNLVENALKYSRPEDVVEIRAAEHDRVIHVEIADTGPGIPAEDLPRIFEELYRGSNARERSGSGLGLALVKRIIERHGGTVSVHSRRDGATGSIFTVRLPAGNPAEPITKR